MAQPLGSDERSGVAGRRGRPRTWRARIASLAVLGTVAAITAGCTGGSGAGSAGGGGTTFVGTPRTQTLIMDNIDGRIATPGNFNPYLPGTQIGGDGVHALVWSPLWEIDTTKGSQFPDLASKPIEPLDSSNTKFRIDLRQGLYWSDGVEFTADDVLYTANMLLTHPKLTSGAWFKGIVKSVKPINKFALEVDTLAPQAHMQRTIGTYIWDNNFHIMPAHIWSHQDPMTYANNPPVGIGPYKLVKYDPQGNWFLWQLRDDWQRSDVGMITGKKPAAKYILVDFYGTEQQRVIAASQHKLDVLMPVSPGGWQYLQQHDTFAQAWYDKFPYADLNDPANRSIFFNDQKFPYNQWQVRWALALSINTPQTTLAYKGMLRSAILPFAATDISEKSIYGPLQPWLESFSLPDGYRPYDPGYAAKAVALLKQQGIGNIPTDANYADLFGPGSWKYDPAEAAKLLKSVGFKQSGGKWLLPNGQPWSITVNAPANFEPESATQGCAVANQWQQFGIDATCNGMDSSSFWTAFANGTYDAGAYWNIGFLGADSSDVAQPLGDQTTGSRWNDPQVPKLLAQMAANTPGDPKTVQLELQLMKVYVKDLPYISMFSSTQLVPTDDYYWTNFPTSTNNYNGPWWWWSSFKFIVPYIKPTGR